MDCEKFESLLIDELYGELDEVTSAAVRRHAAGCARCGALLSGLRATRKVAALPVEEPSSDLEDRILSAVREQQKVLPFRARLATAVSRAGAWAMRPQTAMAAVFLVVIGTSFVLVQSRKSTSAASYARAQFNSEGAPVQAGAAAATPTAMASAYAFDERETAFAHGVEEKRDLPSRPMATATTATTDSLADLDKTKDNKNRDESAKKETLALNAGPIGGVDQAPGASNEQQITRGAIAGGGGGTGSGGWITTTPPMAQAQTQQPYAPGDPNAALAAARAEKARNGCGTAVTMFEALRGRSPVGNEATLEAARCYRALGNSDAARARYASLANTPYATAAQTELDAMNPAAVAARKAAPVQPTEAAAHARPTATTAPQTKPAQKAGAADSY